MKRKWLFYAQDEDGDGRYLQDVHFEGTYEEACHYADTLADQWEEETGGTIECLTIESHGKV
jgi:hypothetical protein